MPTIEELAVSLDDATTAASARMDRDAAEIRRLRERVVELDDTLVNIAEYWNRDENPDAMTNALWFIIGKAEAATAAPQKA